jgi:hypothetical protein
MMSPVTSTLGSTDPVQTPPQAARATAPGWRDPRLWIGVAIVAASVLLGARVLARADDSVVVWAASGDLAVGQEVQVEDLVGTRVRFLDDADRQRYLPTDETLPQAHTLTRPVAAGELVPRSALGDPAAAGLLSVPVSLPELAVPPDVGPGSVVDVWVTGENGHGKVVSRPLLNEVVVLAAPASGEGFAATGDRQLVLAVSPDDEEALGATLAAVGDAGLTVVGRS